jgi:hypothetical protein
MITNIVKVHGGWMTEDGFVWHTDDDARAWLSDEHCDVQPVGWITTSRARPRVHITEVDETEHAPVLHYGSGRVNIRIGRKQLSIRVSA